MSQVLAHWTDLSGLSLTWSINSDWLDVRGTNGALLKVGSQDKGDIALSQSRRFRWFSLHTGIMPDPRFTLANERTFLAWIRTALGLLAGGIALAAFSEELFSHSVRLALAISLVTLSMGISIGACFRWLRVEQAMRLNQPIPPPLQIPILSLAVAVVTLLVALLLTLSS
jgi:putative membrane protein